MNEDMIENTTENTSEHRTDYKRKSRVRIWVKRIGRYLSKWQTRRRYKASYLDTEDTIPPPYRASITKHMPRHTLSLRRSKPTSEKTASTNSRVNNTGSLRALPSQGKLRPDKPQNIRFKRTIRLVNASASSLVGGPGSPPSVRFPRKSSLYTPRESDVNETIFEEMEASNEGQGKEPLPGPRSVLSWLDSFHAHQVFYRGSPRSPRSPTLRNDSAADLTIRPGQTRPHPAHYVHRQTSGTESAVSAQAKSNAGEKICHSPQIHSHVALNAMSTENVRGWEDGWEESLQNRISTSQGLCKSTSPLLVVKNKESIQGLNTETTEQEKPPEKKKETGSKRLSQTKNMDKIQEISEEDQMADEEWSGTWKAFDRKFGQLEQS